MYFYNESNLPAKSRAQYERTYNVFIDWQNKNELSEPFSQKTFLQYFQNLQERMKPSSLWSVYSMLRMTINLKHNYDISQHKELLQYLKQISRGYKPKKAKIFTPEQIKDFLTLAPDNEYLFIKVGLIFGVMGACKSHELVRIDISDVEDLNSALLVHIYNTDNNTERQFVISGYYYNICKKYMDLRPDNIGNMTRFFINYQNGRCVKQPIGIHKFGALPMQVAKFLGLPEHASYTAHSFRRSSACLPL